MSVNGWRVARVWFGVSTICALLDFAGTAAVQAVLAIVNYGDAPRPAIVIDLLVGLWPHWSAFLLFGSAWLAARAVVDAPSPRERRIGWTLGALPIASASVSLGATLWFFLS